MIRLAAFLASHLLILAVLTATAWVAGRLAIQRWIETEGLERFAVSTALGLTILAHAAFALGVLGQLRRGPLIVLLLTIHLLGLSIWRDALEACWNGLRHRRLEALLVGFGFAVALAPIFALALYPPTAFDETLYHLPFARAFARSGSLPFLPELRLPIFPQLDELLFTVMLLLADDAATHLVQWLATLVTAVLLIAWGQRVFSLQAGWLAAAVFLGNPIVVHLASTAYIEPVLNLFAAATIHALERWRSSRAAAWLVLAAVFGASAGGTKYMGLFFVGVVAATALWAGLRERRLRLVTVASVVLVAGLSPWYGRILLHTGNPLFPLFPRIFGMSPWVFDPLATSLADRTIAYLHFPWNAVLERDAVGSQPPYSPVYFLALPLLAVGLIREGKVRRLLAIALAYSLLFFVLPPDSRYMTVLLPLVSLALAGTLARWHLPRWVLPALAALLFIPGWAYAVYRIERQGPPPTTAMERDRYLGRKMPGYDALSHLNRLRGRRYVAYGFHTENLVYYAEGKLLGDWIGPFRYELVLPALNDPRGLHLRLRDLGAEYLLLVREHGIRLSSEPEWRLYFRRIYSDGRSDVYELSPFSPLPGT